MLAATKVLGPARFDKVHPKETKLHLGGFQVGGGWDKQLVAPTLPGGKEAKLKFYQNPENWIPGDFLYFKDKDDYSKKSSGFWTGENCFYVGGGKFVGLGLEGTEEEMRDDMIKHYVSGTGLLKGLTEEQIAR